MADEEVLKPQTFGLSFDDMEGGGGGGGMGGREAAANSGGAATNLSFIDSTAGGYSYEGANYGAAGDAFIGGGAPPSNFGTSTVDDDEEDAPLLDELGIHPSHILKRTILICQPWKSVKSAAHGHRDDLLDDNDLAGPLFFCLALGFLLLLQGKFTFGYIYGVGMVGCLGIYTLLNLMTTQDHRLEAFRVVSYLGYSLLPMNFLAVVALFVSAHSLLMYGIMALIVLWCTRSAASLFVAAEAMDKQRFLISYPIGLFYFGFAMITVF